MEMVLLISIGVATFFSVLVAYFDYKTTYIYDWITYPMIIIGLILLPFRPDWYIGLISAVSVFLIFFLFYKYGKIGGGDIKYFMGLCLLVPTYGGMYFILPVFFFAAVFAGLFFGIKFIIQFIQKKYFEQVGTIEFIIKVLLALLFGTFCGIFLSFGYNICLAIGAGILFFICLFVLFFQKYFYLQFSHKIKTNKILEDDIIDLQCFGKSGTKLFDKKLQEQLQEKGIKEVIVYRNLPVFGPFLLFGLLAALFIFF